MQPGARLQASIDILKEIFERGRPASIALADWGAAHRFAGSGDRAWIGNLVYDVLRRKLSLAFLMQDGSSRALALGALRASWGLSPAGIAAMCSGKGFDPEPLTQAEEKGLAATDISAAPPWVQGDFPEWLHGSFMRMFGAGAVAEGRALAMRAPLDLRVNTLKATREKVLKALAHRGAAETNYSPAGVRIPAPKAGERAFNVESDPVHGRGWVEIQDEGSQIAALLAGAGPRMQVADICAGAGGKTLAMAAAMGNTGQIYAYDADPHRFRPIFERLKRAGVRNVQTLPPAQEDRLALLEGRMDLVMIDAPCSGTGVWRRRPDSKWRLTPAHLGQQIKVQGELLMKGAALVKPGGSLAYITCSVLPEENCDRIEDFLAGNPGFHAVDLTEGAANILSHPLARAKTADIDKTGLLLTPARYETDGFFIALLKKDEA